MYDLAENAQHYLQRLCVDIPARSVGSAGNRAATDFFAARMASCGFAVQRQEFTCIDWRQTGAHLTICGEPFPAHVSPYSRACKVRGRLSVATSIEELEATEVEDSILLLRGEITKEQLMPKNFPFYNPDEHRRIVQALEAKQPLAVVAATGRNPEIAGAVYPFPFIEDGDFDIPSVYMTDDDGVRLARLTGQEAALEIRAQRTQATGCNVVARKGSARRKVVVCAHIDSKAGTPGALDNAAGIVTLLLLAELLESYQGRLGVEVVAFNGEDYYASPGEILYLERHQNTLNEIVLAINMDGLGYRGNKVAYSLYDCPDTIAGAIRTVFAGYEHLIQGEQWPQGDHMIFVMNQLPALALTSDRLMEIWGSIAHTEHDIPAIVDVSLLAATARALHRLLLDLSNMLDENP